MGKRKIGLFTAHSPASGGGGAILRSLLPNLNEVEVTWYYTSDKPVPGYENSYLGKGLMGGSFLKDIRQTWQMLNDRQVAAVNMLVQKLLEVTCDAYWIVSHNEGLRLAYELARLQKARPVHITVHDDWAGALVARSVRYRLMANAAQQLTIRALQTVTSFDVISRGMQAYYEGLSGHKGAICHRYLGIASINTLHTTHAGAHNEIRIGHIGSIYKKKDLLAFITLIKDFFELKRQKPVLQMWGCHLTIDDIPDALRSYVQFYPTAAEDEVILHLAQCNFVYAMYPMQQSLRIFAKTSLPTKLTSYLQAGCPVFGHCPQDSTLAEYLNTTGLGVQWNSRNKAAGYEALTALLELKPGSALFMRAREQYFGEKNLEVMNKALSV